MAYWRLHYHLVWATRNRLPMIGDAEEAAIRRSFEITIADLAMIPHAAGIMPDHVHVAVSIPPKVPVAAAVKRLKGASSNAVNHRTGSPRVETFAWQEGYGALSFGDRALSRVINYVEHQAEHHADQRLWTKLEQTDDGYEQDRQDDGQGVDRATGMNSATGVNSATGINSRAHSRKSLRD